MIPTNRSMYKKELDSYLKTNTPRAAFLYGSSYLIEFYSKMIALMQGDKSEQVVFYATDYDFNYVLELLSQTSLFAQKSVVILRLEKVKQDKEGSEGRNKFKEKDIDAFLQALTPDSSGYRPDNFLIIEYYQSGDEKDYAKITKSVEKKFKGDEFISVRFFEPTPSEAINFLALEAQNENLNINKDNLGALLALQDYDIRLAKNELKKLRILDREITIKDIESLCYGLGSISVEDLFKDMFENRGKNFILMLMQILDEGVYDLDILRNFEYYFYRLFLVFCSIKTSGNNIDFAKILGFNPPEFVKNELLRRASKLNENKFLEIFKELGIWRSELIAKHTEKSNKNASICSLIKIQATLS